MRRAVAIALFVTTLGATGCGGGPGRVAAPAHGALTYLAGCAGTTAPGRD
jgi:hypothetical protein